LLGLSKFPSYLTLALLPLGDLVPTVHAHPTLFEGLVEEAEAFYRRAIDILNRQSLKGPEVYR
jgi:hypothetical protein